MARHIDLQDHNNHFLLREIVVDTETTSLDRLKRPSPCKEMKDQRDI
jgi:chaperonin GroEL (HSP60 family)